MSEKRIAVRYAKSLVNLAEEMKMLDSVKKDMTLIDKVCNDNRQLKLMLKSPIILSDKKRMILEKIFDENISELSLKFFKVLSRKNRLGVLPFIATEVLEQYNKINGIQTATITSSVPLTKQMRKEVEQIVAKTSGKKVLLEEKVEKELIGGFVLTIGDRQLDESIAGNLNKLKIKLLES